MALVKYLGHKEKIPVDFPIGGKSKSGVKKTEWLARGAVMELSDSDANLLVKLGHGLIEIVEKPKPAAAEKKGK